MSPAPLPVNQGKGRRPVLLIVDDNEANRRVARTTLDKFRIDSDSAANGAEALEKLAVVRFDGVLMDCQMPGVSGYEAARRIREGRIPGIDPRIPIIALTAYASPQDLEKCREAGMNDSLVKPLRSVDLRDVLIRNGIAVEAAPVPAGREGGTNPILDGRHMAELQSLPGERGGTLWGQLITAFGESVPERLAQMADLARDRRAPELCDTAHRFAGSSANVGAVELKAFALELEKHAAQGSWPDVDERVAALRGALTRFFDCVRPIMPSHSPHENPGR